jgi:hypothetical protein
MNLSRPGKHQDMTIYGRRDVLPIETPRPINSTAVGDVDGDGLDDLIIGAPGDNITSNEDTGLVFVVFGKTMLPSTFDLANTTDLIISGLDANDYEGFAVAVGDINGDGIGDIISGTPGGDDPSNSFPNCGEVHIFFGGPYLNKMDIWYQNVTSPNITIVGNNTGDNLGFSLAVGNLNQDSYDDLIIGAPRGDGFGNSLTNAGEVVVFYGSNLWQAIEDLNTPSILLNVKTIYGADPDDLTGTAVAAGGDFNYDGVEDVAFATRYGDGHSNTGFDRGEAAIIYWNATIMPTFIDLASILANFSVYGARDYDQFGFNTLAFGDVNNDNYSDLVVGAPGVNGQSGANIDAGAAYILYGGAHYTPPYSWDLSVTAANVTVYSSQTADELGTWVDSFDWNDDGTDDIIITIPFGSGPGDLYSNVGEVVVINGSSTFPQTMTIQSTAFGFYLFGAEIQDHFGTLTAHGDLNGDTIQDLVVLASLADAFNNSKNNAGELYVIRGETSKIPRINSIEIKNAPVPLGATLYTKLKPYQFELNITAPLGVNDLKNATIQLDPFGINLVYHWDRAGNIFSEQRDPNNYATIISSSPNATDDGDKNWTLSFNLIFDWRCPRLNLAPVRVDLWNELNFLTWRSYLDVFSIENRLNFTGDLVVKGQDDRTLTDNAWVKKSESINWGGLKVIYEGTTAIYPNATEYTVKLWNETSSWSDSGSTGEEINLTITAGSISLSSDNYTVNITQIPTANDVSNITFKLRLDAEHIHFSNPLPTPNIWLNDSLVTCGITATDLGGTEVDGSTIEYRLSDNYGQTWYNWTSAGFSTDSVSVDVTKDIMFEDGAMHDIQWRGNDTIGNGYSLSLNYSIKVDTEDIIFSNPTPVETDIFGSTNVEFGIDISDNTSGVNRSSIEYSYSTDNGLNWSNWINLNLSGNSPTVQVSGNQIFNTGTGNLVKWRAMDAAGNGPVESETLRFNISIASTELKVFLLSPTNNTEVSSGSRNLKWWCNDNSTNILFNVYLNKNLDNVKERSSIARVGRNIPDKFFETEVLENNSVYYWTVIPWNIMGTFGVSEYGIWNFKVDPSVVELEVPEITPISPTNNSEIQTLTPTFSWELKFKDTVGVRFDIYLGTDKNNLQLYQSGLTRYLYRTPSTEPLENHQTYYWQMKAQGGEIVGMYWSPIWNFHINFTSVIQKTYNFDLFTDKISMNIKQGESSELTFNVINLKKPETVALTIQSSILAMTNETIFTFSQSSVQLQENDTKAVTLTVSIPKNLKAGNYKFTIVGKMTISGDTITKTLDIDLTVESTEKEDGDDKGGLLGMGATVDAIFFLIIIIIIVLLIVLFLLKKRKKEGEEVPSEERVDEDLVAEEEGMPEAGEGEVPMAAPIAMAAPVAAPVEAEAPPEEEGPLGGLEEAMAETEPPGPEEAEAALPPEIEAPPEPAAPVESVAPVEEPPAVEPGAQPAPEGEAQVEASEGEPPIPGDLPGDAYEQPPAAPEESVEQPPEPEQPTEAEESKPVEKSDEEENA